MPYVTQNFLCMKCGNSHFMVSGYPLEGTRINFACSKCGFYNEIVFKFKTHKVLSFMKGEINDFPSNKETTEAVD